MIDLSSLLLLAYQAAEQAAEAAPAAEPAKAPIDPITSFLASPLFPMLVILVLWVLINPFGRREDKKRKALEESLKKNDRVVTVGGIYGIVANVKTDADEIVLKIDEDKDVKITVTKSSILRNLSAGEVKQEKPAS